MAGHRRGLAARDHYELEVLESAGGRIVVRAPDGLEAISPSFVQGFLGSTAQKRSKNEVEKLFDFNSLPIVLREDFEIGLDRLYLRQRN
ncbi:hypothetical protein PhaeoP72_01905 [Phaeobacter inhibens]|nr:hypothetical protein PhaeoP72_01905 [Phaeobacter inhibens]